MPNVDAQQIPPPKHWQDFESLCRDLWAEIWDDPNAQLNGRSGQQQNGVDVSGHPQGSARWAGVQCKGRSDGYGSRLTLADLKSEVEKAKQFQPPLQELVIATTALKDATVEELARAITVQHQGAGLFAVNVWGWEDVAQALCRYPHLLDKHYPNLGPTLQSIARHVSKLGAQFASSPQASAPEAASEAATSLHAQRLERIRRGDGATQVIPSPTVVLHVIPVATGLRLDLAPLSRPGIDLMPPTRGLDWHTRVNHDGVLSRWPGDPPHGQYLQVFKSGVLELVDTYGVQRIHDDKRVLLPLWFERDVTRCLAHWAENILSLLSVPCPRLVCVSVFGINGFELHEDHRPSFVPKATFDRDVLTFTPVVLARTDDDPRVSLKPVFDELWQAAGRERSLGYTPAGKWDENAHPSG